MTISVNNRKKTAKKSFDELVKDLKTSNSEKVRYNAARILGEMGDFSAVEPLIEVLKNDKNTIAFSKNICYNTNSSRKQYKINKGAHSKFKVG